MDNDVSQVNDVMEAEATEALEKNGEANPSANGGEHPENAEVTEPQEDIITDKDLPPGVTEEPQDPEHMDLRKIAGYPTWVSAYLNVSDDEGHLLGDLDLEKEVKKLYEDLDSMDLSMEEDPDLWINRIKELVLRYDSTINMRENTSAGVFTKYRIRLGMLFNFQKELVKNRLKLKWTEWFPENYKTISLRTAQEYMKIAEYSGAIRCSIFGTQRLLQIARQIGKPEGDHPFEKFLEDNGIDFNPEVETNHEELKTVTDIAIARQKLNREDLEEVTDDKVEALVRKGIELTPNRVNELKLVKATQRDLAEYVDGLIETGGKVEPIMTAERKSESFKKSLDRFLDKTDIAIEDDEYLGEVNLELWRQLKEKVIALEQKIVSMTN
jgi:hypothetical protein